MGSHTELGALTSYEVLRSITELITLQRNMTTVIEMNGFPVRIGNNIPRYNICTVKVDFPNARKMNDYLQRYTTLSKQKNKKAKGEGAARKFFAPPSPAQAGSSHFGTHRASTSLKT